MPEESEKRKGRSLGAQAKTSLNRAKKASGPEWAQNPELLLQEARVLALLELADAVRGGPGSQPTES